MERERKYLVRHVPPHLRRYPHERIEQGYLPIRDESIQVRIRRTPRKTVLTIKRGIGRSRKETELLLPAPLMKALWPLTKGKRIAKTRYRIPLGRLVVELDVYHSLGRKLMTAEVEFASKAAMDRFTPPDWFGREVSDEAKYGNQQLAS